MFACASKKATLLITIFPAVREPLLETGCEFGTRLRPFPRSIDPYVNIGFRVEAGRCDDALHFNIFAVLLVAVPKVVNPTWQMPYSSLNSVAEREGPFQIVLLLILIAIYGG